MSPLHYLHLLQRPAQCRVLFITKFILAGFFRHFSRLYSVHDTGPSHVTSPILNAVWMSSWGSTILDRHTLSCRSWTCSWVCWNLYCQCKSCPESKWCRASILGRGRWQPKEARWSVGLHAHQDWNHDSEFLWTRPSFAKGWAARSSTRWDIHNSESRICRAPPSFSYFCDLSNPSRNACWLSTIYGCLGKKTRSWIWWFAIIWRR